MKKIPTCTPSAFGFGFRCFAIVAGRRAPTSSWEAKKSLSNLIKFHDVEHLEEGGIDVGVPSLVEVTIVPMGDGRGLHFGMDFIHDGTLMIQIGDQVGIILYLQTDARLALHFAKEGSSVRDDSIDRILSRYLRQ